MIKVRPQVMTAMAGLIVITMAVIFIAPDYTGEALTGFFAGMTGLALKVIEDKE